VHSISSIYRDLLNNSLDAFSSVINNNLTNVMKIVGSLTLIIAIPTAVFSLFGMNFAFPGGSNIGGDHLPFWIAIISSAVLSLMAWIFAKKHNWL
jgi:magnesium transporter